MEKNQEALKQKAAKSYQPKVSVQTQNVRKAGVAGIGIDNSPSSTEVSITQYQQSQEYSLSSSASSEPADELPSLKELDSFQQPSVKTTDKVAPDPADLDEDAPEYRGPSM